MTENEKAKEHIATSETTVKVDPPEWLVSQAVCRPAVRGLRGQFQHKYANSCP